jgi:hypothetical protein
MTLRVSRLMVSATIALGLVLGVAGVPAQAAVQTKVPRGYCSRGLKPGCVEWTHQIATATNDSPSYYVNKGGSLTIQICDSYSNQATLGAQFGPIKNFLSLNFSVTIVTSYSVCSGASTPVTKSGYYHWHGSARRWQSKVYEGLLCGAKYCIPNYHYNVAEDRWHYRVYSG